MSCQVGELKLLALASLFPTSQVPKELACKVFSICCKILQEKIRHLLVEKCLQRFRRHSPEPSSRRHKLIYSSHLMMDSDGEFARWACCPKPYPALRPKFELTPGSTLLLQGGTSTLGRMRMHERRLPKPYNPSLCPWCHWKAATDPQDEAAPSFNPAEHLRDSGNAMRNTMEPLSYACSSATDGT